eukprot:jgi/Phyca11/560970/estExt2_Genewise1.C_PHYCAscaffold_51041
MKIHGESEFSMYATPILSEKKEKVLYDVFASFKDDEMLYNYTLVDGIPYAATLPLDKTSSPSVTCIDSESGTLPAINSIVVAINQATAVANGNSIDCASGRVFKVTVHGVDFALCSSSSGFSMHGTDMDIKVGFLEERVDIIQPTGITCEEEVISSSVTSIGTSLLTGQEIPENSRNLKAAFDFSFRDKSTYPEHHFCSCKSTQRACIFIHGMGIDKEEPDNVDSFDYYWGNLTDHAPCCSSIKYAVLDTVNNSWTNDTQQFKVCNRALAVSETSSDSVIKDTILVTHSMGNLMLAGAIASGKCSLDSSTSWVGLAGPMKGSMGSDFVQASCAGETNDLLEQVADITGKCPPTNALISLAYQGERFSSVEQDAAYTAAQEAYTTNVTALMCSEGYSGLVSKYQAEFWVLGATVPHKSGDNDGMVEFESCAAGIPATQFGETWRSKFYRTKLNHYDSEFLYGDGLLSEAKMPVKWFECLL